MTGKSGMMKSMGLQRVGHNRATELNVVLPSEAVAARQDMTKMYSKIEDCKETFQKSLKMF